MVGRFEQEMAVIDLLGVVILDPDGHFEVVHFLHVGTTHVAVETQMVDFASAKRERGALCIGQHLHHHMVKRSLAVDGGVVVRGHFAYCNVNTDIVQVGKGHQVGSDVDRVAFHRIGSLDFHG